MKIRLFKKKEPERGKRPSTAAQDTRPAFSYYAADKARKPEEGARPRKQTLGQGTGLRRLRMVPTVLAICAIIVSIVYSTTLSTVPSVTFVGDPSPYFGSETYKALAHSQLQASLLNRSKLTINTGKIEKTLLAASPELDAVKLALPILGRRPTLTLHARQPALILTTKTSALVLDSSGKAVSDIKNLPSVAREKLLTLQDESGLELKIGDQAVTNDTVAFIDNVRQQLAAKSLSISKLALPTTPNEIDIYITGLTYYVKADVTGSARLQIGTFLAAKNAFGTNRPGEYVDVRVEEKVFYK